MRIAYLHYLSPGDSALTHVGEFARAARELGAALDVHGMNLDEAPAASRNGGAGSPSIGRTLKRGLARYLHEPKKLAWNWRHLRREREIVATTRPDVMLVRADLLTTSYVATARRAGLPLVLEINAPALESGVYKGQYAHLPYVPTLLERRRLASADAIVVVSSTLKAFFVERYGVPNAKITVVPNGADVRTFRPDVAPEGLDWCCRETGPVVGFVGSFQEFHGIDVLARMILRVGQLRPQTRFLLVGEGARADALRGTLAPLGDRVRFTGRVPHERVPALVAAFDIGVLPETAFYCSPLKVVEWMAAGRAIVAPAYGSVTDLVADGREALLFPPRDEEALVAAVVRAIDDPALRARLGQAARERVTTSLTWQQNARSVLAVCTAAAAARSSRAAQPTTE